MNNKNFKGIFTAVVTPFNNDGSIDIDSFTKLLILQKNADGLIIGGTTGESSTLQANDLEYLIKTAKNSLPNMIIIAATGSNCTNKALALQEIAQIAGADAHLSIVPYYNKPTQKGLFAHFSALSKDSSLPIIMYNNPARVIINLELTTIKTLVSECKNIVAIKEANADLVRLKILTNIINVLGGDDEAFWPFLQAGACGMISTISNIALFEMQTVIKAFANNDIEYAKKITLKLEDLSKLIFSYNNPIAIKTILAHLNLIKPNWRLPLCALETQEQNSLLNNFKNFEWLKLVKEINNQ